MSIGLTGELTADIYVRYLRTLDAPRADNANTSCAVGYRAFPLTKKARTIECGQRRTQLLDYAAFFSIEVGPTGGMLIKFERVSSTLACTVLTASSSDVFVDNCLQSSLI